MDKTESPPDNRHEGRQQDSYGTNPSKEETVEAPRRIPRRLTSFGDYCRSNGPRVGKPEAQNLSRHRGRLRPSKDPKTRGRLWESAIASPTTHSQPNPEDGYDI